eukprot:CAMPEP_0178936684 /NCGR_PEP_ID=MMETSP0786-20121207/25318_1 /TAXON_ID=186022 /ORGANISM="Thalassionema frauenfeldii, Strain CCMP 1798" /LENGTH=439 /DNA_ID=CAMNT_0020615131 /DNA_START=64 /DNA_END=1383 /DNA_ORIENTATION=+
MQSISRNFHPQWNEMRFFNREKPQLSIPVSFTRNLEDNERELESQDDGDSYLVDRKGNEYEPYALAWRYLGMYIDCDVDAMSEASYGRRRLEDDVDCSRKVLWAAYVDPRYSGGSIGEYQYFNLTTLQWDKQYCKSRRCVRMDCHEPNTHFKLVGVFKETDGMEDWAEQLFKHEGICLWNDEDGYEFMQKYREIWPNYCYQLSLTGDDGGTLYLHMKPEAWGNFSYGIYSDEDCSQESEYVSFSDYVQIHYNYYYGSNGNSAAQTWNSTFSKWNDYMNVYKICQPCRAYNLLPDGNMRDYEGEEGGRRVREENDGQGDAEQWGYDCYDDAGYRNCNQCYKFETHTDYEQASTYDLARASKQGTILRIKVDGVIYGEGGYTSEADFLASTFSDVLFFAVVGTVAVGLIAWATRAYLRKNPTLLNSLKEKFEVKTGDAVLT